MRSPLEARGDDNKKRVCSNFRDQKAQSFGGGLGEVLESIWNFNSGFRFRSPPEARGDDNVGAFGDDTVGRIRG